MILLHAKEWVTVPRLTMRDKRIAIIEAAACPVQRYELVDRRVLIDGAYYDVTAVGNVELNGHFEAVVTPLR